MEQMIFARSAGSSQQHFLGWLAHHMGTVGSPLGGGTSAPRAAPPYHSLGCQEAQG